MSDDFTLAGDRHRDAIGRTDERAPGAINAARLHAYLIATIGMSKVDSAVTNVQTSMHMPPLHLLVDNNLLVFKQGIAAAQLTVDIHLGKFAGLRIAIHPLIRQHHQDDRRRYNDYIARSNQGTITVLVTLTSGFNLSRVSMALLTYKLRCASITTKRSKPSCVATACH